MQILIKALSGKQFKMDINPEKTVQDLKEEIEKNEGSDHKVDNQKLIYEGKILNNSSKLSEYNIDAKKFLVLLITRPPPPPKKVEEPKQSVSKKDDPNKDKDKKSEDKLDNKTSRESKKVSTTPAARDQQSSTTQSNPNSSGISQTNPSGQSQTLPSTGTPGTRTGNTPHSNPAMLEEAYAIRLNNLMSSPHFANLQSTLHQSPHLLSSAIESLETADPEMYRFVSENPDVFLNALNAAPNQMRTSSSRQRRSDASARGQALMSGGGGGSEQLGISNMLPSATDHDRQAIERLKELGFSELQAVQAYVACDKDEQLAANLLFNMEP